MALEYHGYLRCDACHKRMPMYNEMTPNLAGRTPMRDNAQTLRSIATEYGWTRRARPKSHIPDVHHAAMRHYDLCEKCRELPEPPLPYWTE